MTSLPGLSTAKLSIAEAVDSMLKDPMPLRFSAYDGSATGHEDSPYEIHLANERGLNYILTAPGDLGFGRAYVAGDLVIKGVHPGDPYEAFKLVQGKLSFRRPGPAELVTLLRSLGVSHLRPPAPPPQEAPSKLRRTLEGLRHSLGRDAEAIHHHYDVSNAFYEMVLGPSMTYTCAVFPTEDATLEEAQAHKYDLVARKLDLQSGQRLLDLGCGWGGMVRHAAREYGVHALGVTLSREQASWATQKIKEEGLDHLAEVRFLDYRLVEETDFDAVSSIGLTEHIGVKNYPSYFGFIRDKLRPHGRLLNHCITRPHNRHQSTGEFLDRYVFPDGELIGSGRIITDVQNVGLEVQHEENFRIHYAKTLAGWCQNLVDNWDACVDEVGEGTARVWGLYMAGSRIGFERNEIQLHHVLATKTDEEGLSGYPLRHDFGV
ncbi:MAG TPA: cyclopropane-fatty-acyl-phospholipid synthase family protein [Nocardioides sp.]|uniref:SAM-dependent methyltransferase n=1 Tax=uncultured Nocardioides sp. TaxID=198441 RepID=UPI000ED953C8|nr:cyclopropane-fatty-acyl-phospholipid synthase family protein [uncultured Nocardioides sp.]HCB03066.1 SAM-dependent methyltransferase [Nocardioides sp.]HRD60487.1 cyclopropane-fatty-acyl-phospholipid synthase family protein [Nocardioides sp.]HRI94446.1 cyclopropane-fatty-acyl-phospholipid synthase family protein [Nocardioides sp.]HRK45175.1 cyclopropane-fatty-acyl-phospholipid synthase family protein [Nocardioides sp.]